MLWPALAILHLRPETCLSNDSLLLTQVWPEHGGFLSTSADPRPPLLRVVWAGGAAAVGTAAGGGGQGVPIAFKSR